jgi:CRISPR-associated endonuclease/helicase Cas3
MGSANNGSVDFGVHALDRLIRDAREAPPPPAQRHAPVMLPAHVDAWVQTSPRPCPDPDVAPFLHGPDALEAADVQIIWRADLSWDKEKRRDQTADEWIATVTAARPVVLEGLPVSVGTARSWLQGTGQAEVADVEGLAVESSAREGESPRPALRWGGPDSSQLVEPQEIRPGDKLVVPAAYGGADSFGWRGDGGGRSVPEVGDACFNLMADAAPGGQRRRPIRLRLHPALLEQLLPVPQNDEEQAEYRRRLVHFAEAVQRVRGSLVQEDGSDPDADLRGLLATVRELVSDDPQMATTVDQFLQQERLTPTLYPGGIVLTRKVSPGFSGSPRPLPPEVSDLDEGSTQDDTSSLTRPVTLNAHLEGVADWAGRFAKGLGERLTQVVQRAARLHDLGKADTRFQTMLYGGDPLAASVGEPLAKSGMDRDDPQAFERAWRLSGLPLRFRHEFVSVALTRAGQSTLFQGLPKEEQELVEYLIGVHHGRGRPFVPVTEEREAEPVSLEWDGTCLTASADHGLWSLGAGWTDLFWRLVRRHGYWGLAYLETLLVLADHARSAEEERQQA